MGRTIKEFALPQPMPELMNYAQSYLTSEGYTYKERKGEQVFQKGSGLVTGPTFIKITLINNIVRLEGWMKMALLPGVYVGETDLDDFLGCAAKGPLKRRYAYLENMIRSYGGVQVAPGFAQAPFQQPQYQQPVQYQQSTQYQPSQYQQAAQPPQMPQQQAAPVCNACAKPAQPGAHFCANCGNKLQ